MSETENNTGKLIPVKLLNGESNEGFAFRVLDGKKDEWDVTYLDALLESGHRDYFLFDNILYSIKNERDIDDDDVFLASKNSDGSIDYRLRYYNGGCGFNEAMETALERMKTNF